MKDRDDYDENRELSYASVLIAIVGVGYLFPFSALTQPIDFWHAVFPDFNIEFPLTTLYMWTNLLVLGGVVFLGRKPSYSFRIVAGFIGQFLVLMLVPSLYFLHLSEDLYFLAVMSATAFAAIVTALVDSVAIGFAAHYPPRMQGGLQLGIGLSTLIGSIYRIITKIIFPVDQVVESSLIYFYTGALTTLVCIVTYYHLVSLKISKKYLHHHNHHHHTSEHSQDIQQEAVPDLVARAKDLPSDEEESLMYDFVEDHEDDGTIIRSSTSEKKQRAYGTIQTQQPQSFKQKHHRENSATSNNQLQHSSHLHSHPKPNRWQILSKCAFNQFLVFLVFFTSLLLWPALVTEIDSHNFPVLKESRWWSLLLLLLFSLLDCLGRLCVPYRFGLTPYNIWLPIVMRLFLIPLLICSAKGKFFRHDGWSILFVGVLGFTNGYHGSLAVIMTNEIVESHERGMAGSFTGFFLNFGLVFGATGALLLEKLIS